MNILRHVAKPVLYCIFIVLLTAGIIFLAFPLDDWTAIVEQEIAGVPVLFLLVITPIIMGVIIGVANGWHWRQQTHLIESQLDELIKGQKLTVREESYKEFNKVQERLEQLQEKLRSQTEHAQRLATERANAREKSLQEVVVQERNRLARELHDSVSQQLFAASMMMTAINEANPPKEESMKKQLAMVEKMIHQSQLEMRALLLHLRPVALKGKSLQEGVDELLIELTQKVPMEISWKVEQFPVAKGVEDQLFRILQESVSNTLRHAKATTLNVMLIDRDDTIILRVVDNGVGFDVEKVRASSSYGLENMRERAYEVGGTLKIISLPNQGTRLEVKVPRLKNEDDGND